MLVMVVFFIAFRWIHLSTPLIRLFLLVLILLLMPTLNFLPVWFALSLLRFRLPSRLPMMFILWMVAMLQLDNQKEIAEMQNETQKEIAGIQSATSRQNTKDQVYAQNEMLAYQQKESTARVASIMENTNLSKQQQVSEIMRQM